MPSLVTLLPFVFELSSKNHRGGGQNDPPPTRAKVKALDLCNFQQYCIVLQWVKESSRRGDVTANAAAEW